MQLSMQPMSFRLNQTQLVKIHLTFMRFFLNRKESLNMTKRTFERLATINSEYEPPSITDIIEIEERKVTFAVVD